MVAKIILIVTVLAAATPPVTQPATNPSRFNEAGFIVTRMDVASAYLLFERTLHDHPLPETERARVHREFDRITGMYFLLQYSPVVRALHELSDSISPQPARSVEAKLARALRVRLAPPVSQPDMRMALRVKISPMYAVNLDQPVKLKFEIVREGERQPVLQQDIVVQTNGLTPVLTLKQPTTDVGKYRVDLVAPDGFRCTTGHWYVGSRPMDMLRTMNAQRLTRPVNPTEQMVQARGAVSARNALLADRPQEAEGARYFYDPNALAHELDRELAELESGNDPFVNRKGDYWRSIYLGDFMVPCRIYAPANVVDDAKPAPLVLVLHGAGGEEGMFFEAYGLGEIKQQADKHGFIVVAPRMDVAKRAPDQVNGLIRAMSFDYLIDTKRVYAIGHSTGALTAEAWADLFGDRLAAVVQIAGASEFKGARTRPATLLIGGELDLIFPPDQLRAIADSATQRGLRVQLRRVPNAGHTLIVGEVLPEAIDWLLSHGAPTTAPSTAPSR